MPPMLLFFSLFFFFLRQSAYFVDKGGGGMGVKLYEHNEKAYRAAARMLAETGRAAVIHPTGTGKSFIGFRLCEEHPEQRVCWLSPS